MSVAASEFHGLEIVGIHTKLMHFVPVVSMTFSLHNACLDIELK